MTVVAVLGAGPAARMLALAGYPLGLRFVVLDPSEDAPAGRVAEHIHAPFEDSEALDDLARTAHLVTYEFEGVPMEAVRRIEATGRVFPGLRSLEVARDRILEKGLFRDLGIPTAPFEPVDDLAGLERAVRGIGLPAVLKTRRHGHDGEGRRVIRHHREIRSAFEPFGNRPLILERFVPFERELSILAVRSVNGETAFWPLVQKTHAEGTLRLSVAPAPDVPRALQEMAEQEATRVLDALGHVGVLAVSLFQQDGVLHANDIGPGVRDSGHWTIEGAETGQFENHLRAGLGLPLGPTDPVGHSATVHFVGDIPPLERLARFPGLHLQLYDRGPLPGRSVGHATFRSPDPAGRDAAVVRLSAWLAAGLEVRA